MNKPLISGALASASLLSALLLGACSNGSDTPAIAVKIDNAPTATGSYTVSLGDATAPTVGKLYVGADGSKLLVVNDANELATTLYKSTTNGAWQRTPAPDKDVSIALLGSTASTPAALVSTDLARSYNASVGGTAARFSIAADGKVTAASDSTCKVSGQLATSDWLVGVRKLSLAFSNCGSLPASADGYAMGDVDYAPAKLRIVLEGGSRIDELWVYAD